MKVERQLSFFPPIVHNREMQMNEVQKLCSGVGRMKRILFCRKEDLYLLFLPGVFVRT